MAHEPQVLHGGLNVVPMIWSILGAATMHLHGISV